MTEEQPFPQALARIIHVPEWSEAARLGEPHSLLFGTRAQRYGWKNCVNSLDFVSKDGLQENRPCRCKPSAAPEGRRAGFQDS